jgi:cytochrome P450
VSTNARPRDIHELDEADRRVSAFARGGDGTELFDWLHEHAPVHDLHRQGVWILCRHADCSAVLQDRRVGGKVRMEWLIGAGDGAQLPPLHGIVSPDDAVHDRTRAPVAAAITPHAINRFKIDTADVIASAFSAFRQRADGDAFDLEVGADLVFDLLVKVMARFIGLPPTEDDALLRWVRGGALGASQHADPSTAPDASRAAREITIFVHKAVRSRERSPQDDLISTLVNGPQRPARADITRSMLLLLGASVETMTAAVDGLFVAFGKHPHEYERLRVDDAVRRSAVEEVFRWTTPGAFAGRTVSEPLTIGGAQLEAGDSVLALLAAANRDPTVFRDPGRFDIGRWPNPHLSFAAGPMRCVGASLARVQMRLFLDELTRAVARIEPLEKVQQSQQSASTASPTRVRVELAPHS